MVPEDWEREFNKKFQVHACRRGGKKGREKYIVGAPNFHVFRLNTVVFFLKKILGYQPFQLY